MSHSNAIRNGVLCTTILTLMAAQAAADTIRVPLDQPTIQAAIDAAVDGDVVSVAPGTYVENIDFLGKAITVLGEQGPEETVIDGGDSGTVVTFASGEGRDSVLSGFTLQNGNGVPYDAGGVEISRSSPTLTGNRITANRACSGVGVTVRFGSPLIRGNVITGNAQAGCSGGVGGGGVAVVGAAAAELLDNVISNNTLSSADGGGVSLFAAGNPVIRGNVISNNGPSGISPAVRGGGISMINFSNALIVQNLIVGNRAGQGAGIYWQRPSGPTLVNNTIANNNAFLATGSAVLANGVEANSLLVNNILAAPVGQTALTCGDFSGANMPTIEFNNVFSESGPAYGGICSDQTGVNGNISADPLFVDPAGGDYAVADGSPVIDAGNNRAPEVPATDLLGNLRVVDGDGDELGVVDMGAIEFQPTVTPVGLSERLQHLIETVEALDIEPPLKLRLKIKLKVALWFVNGNNLRKETIAVRLLESFVGQVEPNRGRKIEPADIDLLVPEAQAIIDALLNPSAA